MPEWILFLIFLITSHVLFCYCYITGKTNLILLVSFTFVACTTAHCWRCVQVGWRCRCSSFKHTYYITCNLLMLTPVRKHPIVPVTHLKVWVPTCCAPYCHSRSLCRLLSVWWRGCSVQPAWAEAMMPWRDWQHQRRFTLLLFPLPNIWLC